MTRGLERILDKCESKKDGIHVISTAETGQYIVRYCKNCGKDLDFTDK